MIDTIGELQLYMLPMILVGKNSFENFGKIIIIEVCIMNRIILTLKVFRFSS